MVHLLVSESRNTDPVRFFNNRIRVLLGEDYSLQFWVDEDVLFSYLDNDQKKSYLLEKRGKPLELTVSPKIAKRLIESGHVVKGKRAALSMIDELGN